MAATTPFPTPTGIDESFFGLAWPGPASAGLGGLAPAPGAAAVVSADMIGGFVKRGSLASPRVGALAAPVADLFQRAHDHGIRRFVLLQDTHHPETPEFAAWPVHAVLGTEESATIPNLRDLPFAHDLVVIEKNSLNPTSRTGFDRWPDGQPTLRSAIVGTTAPTSALTHW